METEERVRVGRVIKPHGVGGELVVEAAGESLPALTAGSRVWVGESREVAVVGIRPHAGRWLVRIEGVEDRDAADEMRGTWLSLPRHRLAGAGPGEAYVDDLVGCDLMDDSGTLIGRIVGVLPGAAHEFLEVETGKGTELVPMVATWLVDMDLEARTVRMRLPDGLL